MKNNRLGVLRNSKRLTQQEVADKIGEPKRTYASWERGERKIPNDILIKLADLYETTVDDLIGRTVEPPAQPDELMELARRYEQLDDNEKRLVSELVDRLSNRKR